MQSFLVFPNPKRNLVDARHNSPNTLLKPQSHCTVPCALHSAPINQRTPFILIEWKELHLLQIMQMHASLAQPMFICDLYKEIN
jgi:hypothetical protein